MDVDAVVILCPRPTGLDDPPRGGATADEGVVGAVEESYRPVVSRLRRRLGSEG